jgi:hypothetical protein
VSIGHEHPLSGLDGPIVTQLETNRPAAVWQRLRDVHGFQVGLTRFRRYVSLGFPDEVAADDATGLRPDVEPGSEAKIHYPISSCGLTRCRAGTGS